MYAPTHAEPPLQASGRLTRGMARRKHRVSREKRLQIAGHHTEPALARPLRLAWQDAALEGCGARMLSGRLPARATLSAGCPYEAARIASRGGCASEFRW